MDTPNPTTQTNNTVNGHLAGRDVNVHNNNVIVTPKPSQMAHLLDRYRKECDTNSEFKETVDSLRHYKENVDVGIVVGIEKKLEVADRQDQIESALRLKELFAKQLQRHQFSKSAQEIFAYLLGMIDLTFQHKVIPLIREGKSRAEIDDAVQVHVILPILQSLEDNDLRIFTQEIRGMVYFLTGNCHLRWK